MAVVFQNLRWRWPPSWILATMHFRRHRYIQIGSPDVSTNFGNDRSNGKEMAAVFRFKDGDSRHLEKYTSGWTTITRNEFSVISSVIIFNLKCNFYWGILTFKGSLLSGALMLKRYCKKSVGATGLNVAVIWTGDPLIVNLKAPNPVKVRVPIGTRLLSH